MPGALARGFHSRMRIETMHAEYTFTRHFKRNKSPCVQHREDRIAKNDILSINRGDDDGVVFGPRGDEIPQFGVGLTFASNSELELRSSGERWVYFHDDVNAGIATLDRGQSQLGDLRSVGLGEAFPRDAPTELYLRWQKNASKYIWSVATANGGIITVTATRSVDSTNQSGASTKHNRRIEWLIDPTKDHAIIRWSTQTLDNNDKLVGKPYVCDTEYKVIDGFWLPVASYCENEVLSESVKVHHATINQPKHPNPLTPSAMAMPIGVNLHFPQAWGGLPDPKAVRIWDGESICVQDEWEQIRQNYDTGVIRSLQNKMLAEGSPGRFPRWWKNGGESFGLEGLTYQPALWEVYVRRWIYRNSYKFEHPITKQQKTSAAAILKDCQSDAYPLFQRINRELSLLDAELAGPRVKDEDRKVLRERRDKLTEPISLIFDTRLRPRLNNLLDGTQRAERNLLERASSKPAR